ncbi:LysM peptidoglycan-binding domain-containing protein [Listeria aquatica]|uniref:LysM peptidoglycan-binding domain-containing protein n=1 Tax=Listeria aquatica TaxID=1494960 RepID=UPI003F6F6A9D
MNVSRKERIEAAKLQEKDQQKKDALKKGVALAGFTAAASSVIVPAYATTVSADEVAANDQNGGEHTPAAEEQTSQQNVEATSVAQPIASYSASATYSNIQKTTMRSTATVQGFINQISGSASQIASQNDLYASVMMAQAILESAYGTSMLGSVPNYNLFGIKGSYNGQSVLKQTMEDDGKGNLYPVNAYFRKYPSYHQSLEDYARVIKGGPSWNPNYYAGAWKSNTASYLDATKALTGTYATDTSYSVKLNNLIKTYNLTQFDTPGSGNNAGSSADVYYTVKKGDTLWRIATRHSVSVAALKSMNNLKSDTIYVNQKLIVKKGTVVAPPTSGGINPGNSNTGGGSSAPAKTYKVSAGDTLWRISSKFGVSVANLKSWNGLKSDVIHVGQVLKVSSSTNGNVSTPKPGNNSSQASYYTVKKGDTLWSLASKNKTSVAKIKSLNKLSSNTIYVGQKLRVK